ncbi:MAG: transposase [Verrucomicrobiales bacterium]|nr:transposase [Verrucomicrobiales bacterium]
MRAQLCTSDCDADKGTVEALEKIVKAIRARFGRKAKILVFRDRGFARDAVMSWCEKRRNFSYLLGTARNAPVAEGTRRGLRKNRERH